MGESNRHMDRESGFNKIKITDDLYLTTEVFHILLIDKNNNVIFECNYREVEEDILGHQLVKHMMKYYNFSDNKELLKLIKK
jgi:hypothetical protein